MLIMSFYFRYRYGKITTMKPSDIRYAQDSIYTRFFVDGHYIYLEDTFEDLLHRRNGLTVNQIETIEIVRKDSEWWTLTGNKRLFLYKKLEKLGIVSDIPVVIHSLSSPGIQDRFRKRFTTECAGRSIKCIEKIQRNPDAKTQIKQLIKTWYEKHGRNEADYLTSDEESSEEDDESSEEDCTVEQVSAAAKSEGKLSSSCLQETSTDFRLIQTGSTESENIESKKGIVISEELVITSNIQNNAIETQITTERPLLYDRGNIFGYEITTSHAQSISFNDQLDNDDDPVKIGQEGGHDVSNIKGDIQEDRAIDVEPRLEVIAVESLTAQLLSDEVDNSDLQYKNTERNEQSVVLTPMDRNVSNENMNRETMWKDEEQEKEEIIIENLLQKPTANGPDVVGQEVTCCCKTVSQTTTSTCTRASEVKMIATKEDQTPVIIRNQDTITVQGQALHMLNDDQNILQSFIICHQTNIDDNESSVGCAHMTIDRDERAKNADPPLADEVQSSLHEVSSIQRTLRMTDQNQYVLYAQDTHCEELIGIAFDESTTEDIPISVESSRKRAFGEPNEEQSESSKPPSKIHCNEANE